MLSIIYDIVECFLEVFMGDFFVFDDSFNQIFVSSKASSVEMYKEEFSPEL